MAGVSLETDRLLLRPFRDGDHEPYAAMCADEEVMRYIGAGVTLSSPDAWRSMAGILGHWALRGYGMYAIEVKATGALAGRVGFIDPPGWPGNERSIRVAERLGERRAGELEFLGGKALVYEARRPGA